MNGAIRVVGGKKLKGEVTPISNKNSIVAAIPAAILTDKKVIFKNVGNTSDVEKILKILELMGAEYSWKEGEVILSCKNLKTHKVDAELGGQFRASLMFVGPLLARFGKAEVPLPGGCLLGMRSISAHVDVFKRMGVKVEARGNSVYFEVPKKTEQHYRVWQLEASVTATENLLMYAAGIESEVEIVDAASEPHVVDLEKLVAQMGAEVLGEGSNRLIVRGDKDLGGGEFEPGPDFVDIAGLSVAAAVTGGEVRIKGGNRPEIVDGLVNWLVLFGVKVKREGRDLIVSGGKLKYDLGVDSNFPLAGQNLPKLSPRPWPGFPVDVIPVMAVLASKTEGRLVLQNWMYESGLDFVRELNSLGANIMLCDPQRAIIEGPVNFKGGEVASPGVIQACKALFLAALADPVETKIHGVNILRRRYPDVFETYRGLGAEIYQLDEGQTK